MQVANEALWQALYVLLQKAFNLNRPRWQVIYPEQAKAVPPPKETKTMGRTIIVNPVYEDEKDAKPKKRATASDSPKSYIALLATELKIVEGPRFNKQFYALIVGALRGNIENGNNGGVDRMLVQTITHYIKPRKLSEGELMGLVDYVKFSAQNGAFDFKLYDEHFITLIAGFLPRPMLPGN